MPVGPPRPGPLCALHFHLLHPPPLLLEHIKPAPVTGSLHMMFPRSWTPGTSFRALPFVLSQMLPELRCLL